MNSTMTLGLSVVLVAGAAIGIQRVFTSIIGQMLGPVQSGLVIHIGGTLVGAVMVIFVIMTNPNLSIIVITSRVILFALLAGTTGMIILMGIAFAFHSSFLLGDLVVLYSFLRICVL